VPLGDLESPGELGVSFLDDWTPKRSLPLWFEFVGKWIDEGERVRKQTREIEDEEVEVEEEDNIMNWGVNEGFAVKKYIIK
jgi:hypothetical protein